MIRAAIVIALAAGCMQHEYPPPDVPRTCSEPQRRESLTCQTFDFEVRFSTDGDLSHNPEVALFHNAANTECGCVQNLDVAVDAAAQRSVRSEVLAGCHCTRAR